MRSVVVVLPASMWAMIPMFRVFWRENLRVIGFGSRGVGSLWGKKMGPSGPYALLVCRRAVALDVAGLGQRVEHLRHRARRQARRDGELPGRQLAALVELDQQLVLGVAELRPAEVSVAAAHAVQRAIHAAEGQRQ